MENNSRTSFAFDTAGVTPDQVEIQVNDFLFGDLSRENRRRILTDLATSIGQLAQSSPVELADWSSMVLDKVFEASPEYAAARKAWAADEKK